ncbi:3-beta hydroxysteroid dehydrogenase-like protein 2 [Elsinoe fawcettii]|nr:3-beta hydroxysteroid dehydrogenase-like protein 2 [Elsinoe fawcettii]
MDQPIKVLVTGSSGFLATYIIDAILKYHPTWHIFAVDISAPATSLVERATASDGKVEIIQESILSPKLSSLFSSIKPDVVLHTASLVPAGSSRYNPSVELRKNVWQTNVEGTRNVLSAAKEAGVKALIYTSSCTVISDDLSRDYPLLREDYPYHSSEIQLLLYGESKAEAERLVLAANDSPPSASKGTTSQTSDSSPDSNISTTGPLPSRTQGLLTTALRPAIIIGPGDRSGTLRTIYSLIASSQTGFVIGSGDNLVDFVDVANVADAHVLAVENLLGIGCFARSLPLIPGADSSADSSEHVPWDKPDHAENDLDRPLPPSWSGTPHSAAGLPISITNHTPIYFRDFMRAIWANVSGHVPRREIHIPASLAWWFGAAAEAAAWVTGRETALSRGSVRDAVATRYADNARARGVLGYVPSIGIADAVKRACDDFEQELDTEERVARKKER